MAKKHQSIKLLNIAALNKNACSTKIAVLNLIQDSHLLCSEESNLIVGCLVHTVLLVCVTHPPLLVCCYVLHRIAFRKSLPHG